jgi:hypothetical protein
MSFVRRAVSKQGERIVASFGAPGETLLHRDLVEDISRPDVHHVVTGLRPKDRRLVATATSRAVYFDRKGELLSLIRYDSIAYVASVTDSLRADFLEIVAHNGDKYQFTFPERDGGLGHTIQERLLRLEPYDVTQDVSGIEVTLRYRPWRPDTMSYWEIEVFPEGVVAVRPDIEAGIRTLREEAGKEVLCRASSGPLEVPRWASASDWLTRDWGDALGALLDHRGQPPADVWGHGDYLDRDGRSTETCIVGVSTEALYTAVFESMRALMLEFDRSPDLIVRPFSWVDRFRFSSESDGRMQVSFRMTNPAKNEATTLWLGLPAPNTAGPLVAAIFQGVLRCGRALWLNDQIFEMGPCAGRGWIEELDTPTSSEGVFDAGTDALERWLIFVEHVAIAFPEQSGEGARQVEVSGTGVSSTPVTGIPWSCVEWVRLASVSDISPKVRETHSEVLARSVDGKVVYGAFKYPGGSRTKMFGLVGSAARSGDEWLETLRTAGVRIKA